MKYAVLILAVALASMPPSSAHAAGKFKVLHNFGSGTDGSGPYGAPILDSQGNLYGVTGSGGTGKCSDYGCGTVFELTPQTHGTWKEAILHSFTSGSGGAGPWGSLVLDGSGNLYGTMPLGTNYIGGVFELSPGSGGWTYSVLYDVSSGPGLLMDDLSNLYGDIGDGQYGNGAIGELSPSSNGWTYTQLYSYCAQDHCPDGLAEPAPPIWDGKGNLYGTTVEGGIGRPACYSSFGCGVIFKMTPNRDGTWAYHVLHRFASSSTDGQRPFAGLVMDTAGNFYGSTALGGVHNNGTIFKFAFTDGHWKKTVLYDFPKHADGTNPGYQMVFDKAGALYGATGAGGLADCGGYECGVVFKLTPQKNGKWKYTVLHKFTAADGEYPYGVIIDGKGNLFGTTQGFGKYHAGTAFEITP
jgi:hypothetical protein